MKTVVTSPVTHRCPHRDEVDNGSVTLTFEGPAPELHDLAAFLHGFAAVSLTHEEFTMRVCEAYPDATIATNFRTAGCEVECYGP